MIETGMQSEDGEIDSGNQRARIGLRKEMN